MFGAGGVAAAARTAERLPAAAHDEVAPVRSLHHLAAERASHPAPPARQLQERLPAARTPSRRQRRELSAGSPLVVRRGGALGTKGAVAGAAARGCGGAWDGELILERMAARAELRAVRRELAELTLRPGVPAGCLLERGGGEGAGAAFVARWAAR